MVNIVPPPAPAKTIIEARFNLTTSYATATKTYISMTVEKKDAVTQTYVAAQTEPIKL